jgi:outer membrane phospholipase A
MIRGRLTSTLDVAYRRETRDYSTMVRSDYDVDTLTTRAGFNYQINRFFTLFSYLEYQFRKYNGSGSSAYNYDYDRWRWTTGIRLTY